MARGVNKVFLIGNLGNEPELKAVGDTHVCNFSLATSESWTDTSGEKQEKTEWHRVVAWGRLAEICGQYLKKGRQIYMEGKIQTRSWEGDDGVKRYTTEVVARDMQMLGTKGDTGGGHASPPPPSEPPGFVNNDNSYSGDDIPF